MTGALSPFAGQPGQRVAAPQRERLAQQRRRIRLGHRLIGEAPEARHVHRGLVHVEQVAAGPLDDGATAGQYVAADAGDDGVEGAPRAGRNLLAPDPGEEPLDGHDPADLPRERGECERDLRRPYGAGLAERSTSTGPSNRISTTVYSLLVNLRA